MNENNKKIELQNPIVHQTNENCQVFTGPVSGCVFAMPGSTVNHTATQQVKPSQTEAQAPKLVEEHVPSEELFKFIHPTIVDKSELWKIHNEIKRLVSLYGIQDICRYLQQLSNEQKILLPHNSEKAYTELVKLGMPSDEGFKIKTFMKYYKR